LLACVDTLLVDRGLPLRTRGVDLGLCGGARDGLVSIGLGLELLDLRVGFGACARVLGGLLGAFGADVAARLLSAASTSAPCCSWATMPTSSEPAASAIVGSLASGPDEDPALNAAVSGSGCALGSM
jgi:hypothetical protein